MVRNEMLGLLCHALLAPFSSQPPPSRAHYFLTCKTVSLEMAISFVGASAQRKVQKAYKIWKGVRLATTAET